MNASSFLLYFVAGLSVAAVLFIVSAGLSLVFGALRVINMAHGSLYMIGAYVATQVVIWMGGSAFGFWVALLGAPLVAAAVGAVIEVTVLKRVYGEEHLLQLLSTYALTLVFAGLVRVTFGTDIRTLATPGLLAGHLTIAGKAFAGYDIFLIACAVAIAGGLYLLMNRTGLGHQIRAAVSDPQLLSASGVNVPRLFTVVFMLGTALAGLGGVLVAPSQAASLGMDSDVLIKAFAISVIGGLGSLTGSLVGALIVGMIISFGLANPITSPFALAFVFGTMAIVLTIRPWGLFGRPEV